MLVGRMPIRGEIVEKLAVIVGAYGWGSIPFGYLLVKYLFARGTDIRTVGSGNVGATNVSRVAGLGGGLLTLVLDGGKGAAAVEMAARLTGEDPRWMGVAAVMAIVGHIFPVWLKGRGGKGVATGLGAYLVLSPLAMGAVAALWLGVVAWKRYVSLGSILAAAAAPFSIWVVERALTHRSPDGVIPWVITAAVGSTLIIVRHGENIRRLRRGTERTIGRRAPTVS